MDATYRKSGKPKPIGWFTDQIRVWIYPLTKHDPILVDCLGGNSNSLARTLADEMGFNYSHITYSDPGSEKNLLTGHCS